MKALKILVCLFMLTFTTHAFAKCKYYSEADVVNGKLINKSEHYTCAEKNQNFFVTFFTEPKWQNSATMLFIAVLENL